MDNNKKKSKIIIFIIIMGMFLLLGITYAFFNYTRTGLANQLVVGRVYLNYTNDSNALSLTDVVPRNSYDANTYIEFTISGLNEHKSKDLWYAVDILHGDIPTGKTETNRIRDDLIRFRLTKKIDNNEEEVLLNNKGYPTLDELRMYVETIPKDTDDEISHTYRLYMWISDDIRVGNTQSSDYTIAEWNNLFASIKVRVVGDYIEKTNSDYVKVVFNANGGRVSPVYRYYENESVYGTLPVPVKDGYKFVGWKSNMGSDVVSTDVVTTSISGTVFKHDDEVSFSGSSNSYIDTGVALFSSENLHRNFYLSFVLVETSKMGNWAPVVSSHYDRNSKGFVFQRRNNYNEFVIQTNKNDTGLDNTNANHKDTSFSWNNVSKVDIIRLNDKIYYALDNATPVEVMDYTGFNSPFDVPVAFGADLIYSGVRSYGRVKLSNMIISFLSDEATPQNYLQYVGNMTITNDITLTATWERDIMETFPEFVTNNKENITKIYFKEENQTDLARYNSATLKGDIATEGSVKTWLEMDPIDNTKYIMYVESETPTYLTTGYELFKEYTNLTEIDFSNIDTSDIESMNSMFHGCSSLRALDLSNFNTENVNRMISVFQGCSSLLSVDLSSFDTRKVTNMHDMFQGCSSLTSLDVSNFNTNKVLSMCSMFQNCSALTSLDVSNFNTSKVTNMSNMFNGCGSLSSLILGNKSTGDNCNASSMFYDCGSLTSLDVTGFNTSKVQLMNSMFRNCVALTNLNVEGFNTSNAINMNHMFYGCSSLTSLIFGDTSTGNDCNMDSIFEGCSGLTNLDLSELDTSKVSNMMEMFRGCSGLTSLDLSNFSTSSVTNMQNMFYNCSGLTSLDLSNFDTSNVTNMVGVFKGCSNIETIYVRTWVVQSGVQGQTMFKSCIKLSGKSQNNTYAYDSSKDNATMAVIATDSQEGYFTDVALKPSV